MSHIAIFFLPPLEYLFLPVILPRLLWMQITGLALIVLGTALFIRGMPLLSKANSWCRTGLIASFVIPLMLASGR